MAIVFATETNDGSPLTFRIVRGTRWQDVVTLTDEVTGLPIDLTGVTSILMRIRRSRDAEAILLELSTDNTRLEVTDAVNGEVTIDVLTAVTVTLPQNSHKRAKYVYDLMIERSADEWEAGISGKVVVDGSTTHPADDA